MKHYSGREEELEDLLNRGALWAVTYGDLMSYLMIFFLIMFTFSLKEKKVAESLTRIQTHFGGKTSSAAVEQMKLKGRETELAERLRQDFQVELTEEKIRVTLEEKVLFPIGAAELKEETYSILKKYAEAVKGFLNPIVIEGHTDDLPVHGGKYKSNFELSMARAAGVVNYLIEREGIHPRRISATAYGEYRPAVENRGPEQRAQNRRIEIQLIRTR